MNALTFMTGNDEKFQIAKRVFASRGITLRQTTYDIDEIQGEDGELIALDKARKAFALVGGPVVVNDDSWSIPGLNGFPGPYMKSMVHWLTADDFLHLTRPLADRRVILYQRIVYKDSSGEKVVTLEHPGHLLAEARGSYGSGWQKVITMASDKGKSVAEVYDSGIRHTEREVADGWRTFIDWYKSSDRV